MEPVRKMIGRWGWLLTPVLAWLALPGRFSWWPLLLVCLVPLLACLADGRLPLRRVFWFGLLTGLLFHLLQIYWIVPVLMTYGGLPWFLAVPALLLLAAYLAVYLALFALGFSLLVSRGGPLTGIFGGAALWVGLDWVRSWLFSGFPWMDIGYGVWHLPFLLQAADLFGHAGYTFLVVAINALGYMLVFRQFPGRQTAYAAAAVAAVVLVLGGYSVNRWHHYRQVVAAAEAPVIGLVQGNVEQGRKWSPTEREKTVRNYLALSGGLVDSHRPELIVWPETALPFYPHASELMGPVLGFVGSSRQPLLTGAPWYEVREADGNRLVFYYNGALLLNEHGYEQGLYFKSHLVPFGEYVPLQRLFPFLAPLVEAAGNFTPGSIERPLTTGRIEAGVLICFESIFGALGRDWVNRGANLLVNVTNDAWYGRSSAPHQSWAMSVFRAVETRRSLVRAANTGISGIVDPLGRVVLQSDVFVPFAAAAPVHLLDQVTFFVRAGFLFAPLCGLAALLILVVLVKRPQRRV